ncbi:MAG: response regulator [Oligoflexales bacterium]|nr:response regulator [Oligoflexales bacterium]
MFISSTKILIVDDLEMMRVIIKKNLSMLGFNNVFEAPDGTVAWEMIIDDYLNHNPFEIVISDLNMPNMQGLQLLRKIRAHDGLKKTIFLMVTAETEMNQIIESAKAGINSYIIKPFTVQTLKEKLQQIYKDRLTMQK